MNILIPWIAVFLVFLGLSFVGTYFQRTEKARRELLKKLHNADRPSPGAQAAPRPTQAQLGRYGTGGQQGRVNGG
jgi:hypothetical protein